MKMYFAGGKVPTTLCSNVPVFFYFIFSSSQIEVLSKDLIDSKHGSDEGNHFEKLRYDASVKPPQSLDFNYALQVK